MKRLLVAVVLLAGCSNGGGDNQSPLPMPSPTPCSAILEWEPPTQRMDETPITKEEFSKFTIFVADKEGYEQFDLTIVMDISDVYLIQWEVKNLPSGQNWFYMTVTDTEGRESGYSNEVSKLCS